MFNVVKRLFMTTIITINGISYHTVSYYNYIVYSLTLVIHYA